MNSTGHSTHVLSRQCTRLHYLSINIHASWHGRHARLGGWVTESNQVCKLVLVSQLSVLQSVRSKLPEQCCDDVMEYHVKNTE